MLISKTIELTYDDFLAEISSPKYPICPSTTNLDPYLGCSHDCLYCFAPEHWRLPEASFTWTTGNPVVVKSNIPDLLQRHLEISRAQGEPIHPVYLSGWTDAYQPTEGSAGVTRKCLEILIQAKVAFFIVTKSSLVLRDVDLLSEARDDCAICLSICTQDEQLARLLEPGAPTVDERVETIRDLVDKGIKTIVKVDPIIPSVNDNLNAIHDLLTQLKSAKLSHVTAQVMRMTMAAWKRMSASMDVRRLELLQELYFNGEGKLTNEKGYALASYRRSLTEQIKALVNDFGFTFSTCRVAEGPQLSDGPCNGIELPSRCPSIVTGRKG